MELTFSVYMLTLVHCYPHTAQGLLYFIPWMAAVPLYLTGGVIITAALRQYLGFWPAAAAAVAVSTFTKALSVYALHQSLGAVREHTIQDESV